MIRKEEKELFEKYNPASDLVSCPRGKGPIRDLLNAYALAATNLYGEIK